MLIYRFFFFGIGWSIGFEKKPIPLISSIGSSIGPSLIYVDMRLQVSVLDSELSKIMYWCVFFLFCLSATFWVVKMLWFLWSTFETSKYIIIFYINNAIFKKKFDLIEYGI